MNNCYKSWKDKQYLKNNVIPSNSRPLTNTTYTGKCGIISSNIINSQINNDTNPMSRYIRSRHPSASKTKCKINGSNGEVNYKMEVILKLKQIL